MRSFFPVVLFVALAGRALALNLVVGGAIGNITVAQVLQVKDPAMTACQSQCAPASTAIADCADDNCLCSNATIADLVTCEQCMFVQVIATNNRKPDPKAGSTPILAAYAAACRASVNATIPAKSIALALPDQWDGPESLPLSLGVTIVSVGFGAILGSSAIFLLSNM